MDGKLKININNENMIPYSKDEFFSFISSIDLPKDINIRYDEKNRTIEFYHNNKIYAVLIDGENWEEIKVELERQRKRKQEEQNRIIELEQLDSLTKLYNKKYSRYLIDEYLKNNSPSSNHALMIIDIDNFEAVNESLGYMFGDMVLVNIAENLNKIFYQTDIASRIGGDEFIIFLKDVSSIELLETKANEIYSIFRNTYTGENKDYIMSCSIGIAIYPMDGDNYEQLFIHADTALIEARSQSNKPICFYKDLDTAKTSSLDNCYEQYNIIETRAYGTNNFDKEITAFAFDIMSRSKDVKSAINLLLNRVRVHFNSNRVYIIERSVMALDYNITYLSDKHGPKDLNDFKFNIGLDMSKHRTAFDENGILCINNRDEYEDGPIKKVLEELDIKSIMQCGIFEDGDFKGYVSVDDIGNRTWTQDEKDSMVTITKIISSYLLKLRASERASKQLYNIKNMDALTGIPTLHKFKKDVDKLLLNNKDKQFVIIYTDINQFKHINDSLGYDMGDEILCDVANLISSKKEHLCYARIGEDNFLMVIPYEEYEEEGKLKQYINDMFEQFNIVQRQKFPGYKFIFTSGASILSINEDITVAIDNANIARKSLKPTTKTVCKFFNDTMKQKMQKELEITNNMESALRNNEFIVYIQPKIELKENKIVGGEALVRWRKPDGSIIPPNDFIPLFEKNGFIVNLDFYIYEEVLKTMKSWMDDGLELIPVSLNVSRIHLYDEEFVDEFKKLVDTYGIPYHLLELELTESIFLNNSEIAINTMMNFRKLGFCVSIDDFGSGYSSLNLLKNMATDVIKLDKEFFGNDIMHNEEKIIVSSIISMAKQLNMKVLSEGIETTNQSEFLKSVSCDMAQGYLYSKPIPIKEFEELVFNTVKN